MKRFLVSMLISLGFIAMPLAFAFAQTATNPSGAARCDSINITRNLTLGSRGSDVVALQTLLVNKGFLNATPTGYYGFATKRAVATYQVAVGISPANGYVGPLTRAYIASHECADSTGTVINTDPNPITPGCPKGAIYNYLTGLPCSNTTTTTGDVSFGQIGSNFLNLAYDLNNKESSLLATAAINITAGSAPITFTNSAFTMRIVDKNNDNKEVTAKIVSVNKEDLNGQSYTLPANTTALFYINATFNPKELFAGTYTSSLWSVTFNQNGIVHSLSIPANTSNAVTIIGEVAPYITSATSAITSQGTTITLKGVRFPIGTSVVTVGSEKQAGTSNDGSTMTITMPSTASGSYSVQISSNDGLSNMIVVTVGVPNDGGCSTGALYNYLTGLPCPTNPQSTGIIITKVSYSPAAPHVNDFITTTVTVYNNSSVDRTTPFKVDVQGTTVTVPSLAAKASTDVTVPNAFSFSTPGTKTLNTVIIYPNPDGYTGMTGYVYTNTLTFDSATSHTITVTKPTSGVVLLPGGSFTITFTGNNLVGPMHAYLSNAATGANIADSKNLLSGTVNDGTILLNLDSQKWTAAPIPAGQYKITLCDDGAGSYSTTGKDNCGTSATFIIGSINPTGSLTVASDPSSPAASTHTTSNSILSNVPLMAFNVTAQGVNETLQSVLVHLTSINAVPTALFLRSGDLLISSQAVQSSAIVQDINFANLYMPIATGTTKVFTVTADYAPNTNGTTAANISNVVYQNPLGQSVTLTPNIPSNTQAFGATKTADVNGDGAINKLDIDAWNNAFFTKPGDANYNPRADVNGDGVIDIADLSLINNAIASQSSTTGMVKGASTMCLALTQNLKLGSTDATSNGEVSFLQDFLETQGFGIEGRGTFGPKTQSALANWQVSQGIDSTGIVGPLTRSAIQTVSCALAH